MPAQELGANSRGIAFLVSAGIVYEIVAAACSVLQTTEINASSRADTLMKWVNIGSAAAVFVVAAAMIDRSAPPDRGLAGTSLVRSRQAGGPRLL